MADLINQWYGEVSYLKLSINKMILQQFNAETSFLENRNMCKTEKRIVWNS